MKGYAMAQAQKLGRCSSFALAFCLTSGLLGITPGRLAAQTPNLEVRTFSIEIDGKHAGQSTMTIRTNPDGGQIMACVAKVRHKVVFVTYTYSYGGTEVWNNGRLLSLESKSDDDGTKYSVTAKANGNELQITANGAVHNTRWDLWTTTYWKLPPQQFRNAAVPLLDADTGKELAGQLQFIGNQQLTVLGQPMNCAHWRLTGGDLKVELWYDGQERLVRQESEEKGSHKTVLTLQQLR